MSRYTLKRPLTHTHSISLSLTHTHSLTRTHQRLEGQKKEVKYLAERVIELNKQLKVKHKSAADGDKQYHKVCVCRCGAWWGIGKLCECSIYICIMYTPHSTSHTHTHTVGRAVRCPARSGGKRPQRCPAGQTSEANAKQGGLTGAPASAQHAAGV
jgi:hypothetical protein